MGLRMFVEPDAVESKTAAKADPTAPARSTIRRQQRTIRYSPNAPSSHQNVASSHSRRQSQGHSVPGARTERISLLEDIRRHGRSSGSQTPDERLTMTFHNPDATIERRRTVDGQTLDVIGGQATHRSRVEVAISNAPEGRNHAPQAETLRRNRSPGRNQHPEQLHRDTTWGASLPWISSTQSSVPRLVHPPYTLRGSPDHGIGRPPPYSLGRADYTPGFAPANGLYPSNNNLRHPERMVEIASLANQARALREILHQHGNELELEIMLSDLNAMMLRNTREMSTVEVSEEMASINSMRTQLQRLRSNARRLLGAGQSRYIDATNQSDLERAYQRAYSRSISRDDTDGLGDRDREQSFSPDAVSWETMLTTIPPDDQVPSNHSSFDSQATSVSDASFGIASAGSSATAPSSTVEVEPCPAMNMNGSEGEDQPDDDTDPLFAANASSVSSDFLSRTSGHLNRIESLSRRLRQQRSQGEFVARHRRIVEREQELQRLEMTLQRLERQLEEERNAPASWQRPHLVRAGRERL